MKNKLYALALSATMILLASCAGNKEQTPAAAEAPKYRAGVDVVFNAFATGNTEGLDTLIDSNFIEHTPPPGMEVKGIEGFKNIIKMNHEGFPDTKFTIIDYTETDDMAYVHYNWKGTNTGPMMGMPATNKAADCNGVDVLKFVNGKCTEHWGYFEETKCMTQLGVMPPMGGDSTKTQ